MGVTLSNVPVFQRRAVSVKTSHHPQQFCNKLWINGRIVSREPLLERWAAWKAAGRAIAAIQLSISFVFIITSFTITGGFVRGNLSESVQLLLLRCFPENLGSFHVHWVQVYTKHSQCDVVVVFLLTASLASTTTLRSACCAAPALLASLHICH